MEDGARLRDPSWNAYHRRRVSAWLSVFADAVIIDEPENDDYKQDELTPRLDARWIVSETAQLAPHLSTIQASTTPPQRRT
jgi:hypothetical protein